MQSLDFTSKLFIAPISSPDENLLPSTSNAEPTSRTACGFNFWLKAQRRSPSTNGDLLEIYLASEPEPFCADSYQLLIDYRLNLLDDDEGMSCASISVTCEPIDKGYSSMVNDRLTLKVGWDDALRRKWIKEIPSPEEDKLSNEKSYVCTVKCHLRLRELLSIHKVDYAEESVAHRRDFAFLVGQQKQFYVDLQYLADQGSEYFRDLLDSKRKGVRRAVLMNVEPSDMEIFLDALCTHRKPVITNRNLDVVLQLAQEFGVDKALRAGEAYLIESESIHAIRKLEYAAEYGLGLLGETVVRQLTNGRPMAALDALHDYLQLNDERIDQMHPDVLNSLNVFEQYVVL